MSTYSVKLPRKNTNNTMAASFVRRVLSAISVLGLWVGIPKTQTYIRDDGQIKERRRKNRTVKMENRKG